MQSTISVQDYLAALKQNRLLGLKCNQCGFITTPPRMACRQCSAHDSVIVELCGRGHIATFTAVYVPTHHRQGKTPYLVALVEMHEGPWVLGNITGTDPQTASIELICQKVYMDNTRYGGIIPPDGITPLFVIE